MFYSQFILAKKGPLGTIWIAAHLERKLRKNQVAETDIGVTVDSILFPEAPIALRLSGHLLLGVVRIYSRQVNYLFNDCSETLGKIKQAFHAAAVDLPPEATTAPFHAITLPETFDFDELELNAESDNSYLHANGNYVDQHVTTREQITLQDTVDHTPYLGSSQFGLDERFGDDGTQVNFALDFDEDFMENKAHPSAEDASTSISLLKEDIIPSSLTDENEAIVLSKNDIAGPSSVYDNEATPMDIDVPSEHVNPGFCEVDTVGDRGKALFDLGTSERDICSNACSHTISIDPLDDHRISQSSQKKDSEFLSSKHGLANLHASSPRILETRTPDLNQEYCPPDEPLTPALVGETSLPIYKETTTDNGGKSSPVLSGHSERETNSEILSGPQQPQINLSTSCTGANEVHESSQHHTASFPTSPTKVFRATSPAPFQVFTHCQTLPMEGNSGAISFETGTIEASSVKDNVTGGASIFSSCSEYTSLQQNKMVFSDESVSFRSLEQASLRQSGAALSQGLSIPLEASQSFSAPAAVLSQLKDSQISSVNGNVVVTSASISSIPQTTCSSQTITGLLQETQISLPQTSSVIDNVPISSVKEGATMAAMVTASSPRQSLAQENTGFLQNSSRLSSTSSPSFPAGVETIQLPSLKEDSAMEPSQQNRTCSSQETASILSHASHSVMSPSATSFPQDKIVPVSSVQESAAVMTKPLSDSFTCLEQRKFDSFQGSTFFTTDGQMVLQQSRAHFFQNADEVSTQSSGSLFQFREPTQYLENIWTPPLRENSVAASETLPSQTRVDVIQDADKISKRPFGSFLQSADSIHQPENIQASTFKENTAPSPVSLPHHSLGTSLQESNNRTLPESVNPSTSQGICLQQIRSSLSQEGTTIPTNALCSSLTSSTAFPLPQLEKVQAQYIKENAATTSTGFPILFQQTLLQQNSTHPLHASAPTVLQQSKLQQNSIGSSQTSAPTISQQSNLLLSQEGPNIPGKALDYSLASSSGKQNAPTTSMASPNSLHQARVQQNSTVSMQTSDATILQRNNLLLSQEGSLSRSSTTSLPEVQSIQTSSIEENTVMATKDIPNFIQQTYSQQNVTGSLQASANFPSPQQSIFLQKVTHLAQESADFTTNTSGSLTSSTKGPLTLLAASMPQHMDAHVTTISSDFCNIPQQACLQQNKTTPLQDNVDISAPQHLSFKKARIILPQDGDTSLTNTSGAMGASSVALMSQLNDAYVSPAMENRPPCPPQVCLQQSRTCLSEDTGRPLQASLHQSRMVLSHEGNDYSIDQSSSLCAPAASMPETGMNLYPFPKNQWGNNTNQVVSRPFPQQILADDQSTPKTAFQMSTESSGFGLANYHHQSVTGRGLMPSLPSQTVVTSSFSTNSASSLIIGNVHQSGQMEHMNLDKSSAGTKGLHWQSVSQQLNPSLSTTMAPLMPSMCMEECETLRSSHHLQSRPSDFTLLQTNTSVNRTTASEVGRNRFYSPNFEEASKESLLSGSDKTPMWRDVSPSMSMRTSSMSTPNLDSRPRDDDVLGSILGPRDNIFKVISTPEAQKTSKADVATKKPKLISRATAKRRKVDLDVMAVLHGDVIRQQLANTEDIRRERRKAPCTRREVWSFLREHEGQDNCSEPTLPELSADIHELYHDVIHGRESKPHPLNGAAEVRGVSKARTGEESDLLAHYVMKISSKEMLSSEGVNRNGSHSLENQVVENASSVLLVDNSQPVSANNVQNIAGVYFSEQLKEIPREDLSAQQSLSMGMLEANNMAQRTPLVDTSVKYSDELKGVPDKAMSVQENICDGLIEADNVEVFRSDELAISHAAIEVQAEKEGPTICFPDAHFTEATSTVAISGTRDIEHDAQAIHVEREIVNAEKLRLPELVEPELGVESLTKAEGQAITSPLIQVPQCTVTSSMGEARIEDQAVQITQSEKEHEMLEQVPEVTLTFGTNEIRSEEQGAQTIQLEEKHEVIENVSEDTFSLDMNETRNKEQDVQATHLEREQEVLEQVKMMSMIDNHSEIVHKEELNQDVIIMHRDRERENQHVSDIHEHACHEGQLLLPSEAASLQSSAMPSAGKDSIDVPAIEDAKLDHGNTATNDVTALAEEKLSASFGVEEDVNIDRFDGEIVAMEIERGTDFDGADPDAYFAEEDNKLPYAEIDYSSDEQELSVKDDSGWSTRTRNVGKYLKTLFQEMGSSSKHMDEAPNLGLERLLSRRTRKEAARMFFETLVLKTKDYVHVVQDVPYHDVLIYPKSKLMKTEF